MLELQFYPLCMALADHKYIH